MTATTRRSLFRLGGRAARARFAAADHGERLHPADPHSAAHDPDGKLIYRAGQALIDPAAPTAELARLTRPFLVPETPEEISGQVNHVVFVEGLVAYRGEWLLYYGQGDAGLGVLHGRSRTRCG